MGVSSGHGRRYWAPTRRQSCTVHLSNMDSSFDQNNLHMSIQSHATYDVCLVILSNVTRLK